MTAEVEAFEAVVFCSSSTADTSTPRESKGEKFCLLPDITIPYRDAGSVVSGTVGLFNAISENIRTVVSIQVVYAYHKASSY